MLESPSVEELLALVEPAWSARAAAEGREGLPADLSGGPGGDEPGLAELLMTPAGERGEALEAARPGPVTLAALSTLAADGLSPDAPEGVRLGYEELVGQVAAWERLAAHVAAGQAAAVAALHRFTEIDPVQGRGNPSERLECTGAEVAAALRLTPRGAADRVAHCVRIDPVAGPLAATGRALAAGRVSVRHTHVIADTVSDLQLQADAGTPEEDAARVAADVQAKLLPVAERSSVSGLRSAARKLVLTTDPVRQALRHAQARAERKVELHDLDHGMAQLVATLPAETAELAWTAVDTLARSRRDTPHPDRGSAPREGIDAARADALADLLAAGLDRPDVPRARVRPEIRITIDAATLLGLAEHPGTLRGYGPIPAPLARALAADGTWRRLVTDPQNGHLLDRVPAGLPVPRTAAPVPHRPRRALLLPLLHPPGRTRRRRPRSCAPQRRGVDQGQRRHALPAPPPARHPHRLASRARQHGRAHVHQPRRAPLHHALPRLPARHPRPTTAVAVVAWVVAVVVAWVVAGDASAG